MMAGKTVKKVHTKVKTLKAQRLAMPSDEDGEDNANPVSDVTVADVNIIKHVMGIDKVFIDLWLKTKTLPELQTLEDINMNLSMHVSARMQAYAGLIDEMSRLNELEQSISCAKNKLLVAFLESYTSKYATKAGPISHKAFLADVHIKMEILRDRAASASAAPAATASGDADMDLADL
jgi:hypothetical protein